MDYGEGFTHHELNVVRCIHNLSHTLQQPDDPSGTPSENLSEPKLNLGGTVKLPWSILPKNIDYVALRPYFTWLPVDWFKSTIKSTTQCLKAEDRVSMSNFKTRIPANVNRLNKTFATNAFFSVTPALDDGIPGHGGCTMVQFFTGVTTHLAEAVPMNAKSAFPETLK